MSGSVKCVECRSELAFGAKKCKECGEYQSPWRRGFIFFASVTGGLTFITAAISYTLQSLPAVTEQFFPSASIEVLSFSENRNLTVINSGDGDVFVRAIYIARVRDDTDQFGTRTINVGAIVKSGSVLVHDLKNDSEAGVQQKRLATVEGADGPITQEWVDIANHIITSGNCYEEVVVHKQDPIFLTVKSHYARGGSTPMTMPNTAILRFYSFATSSEHSIEIPVVGMVYKVSSEECGV